jgi:hypothetical protein
VRDLDVVPGSAGVPAASQPDESDDLIARLEELVRLHLHVEYIDLILEEPLDVLSASDWLVGKVAFVGNPHKVGFDEVDDLFPLTLIERRVDPTHDLDVLLRHRPRSIPRGRTGCYELPADVCSPSSSCRMRSVFSQIALMLRNIPAERSPASVRLAARNQVHQHSTQNAWQGTRVIGRGLSM